ncbi:hypothetical protein PFISCL1PPCAC_12563, partial [Pristionchus fissidentatus]
EFGSNGLSSAGGNSKIIPMNGRISYEASSIINITLTRTTMTRLTIVYSTSDYACGGDLLPSLGSVHQVVRENDDECIWTIRTTPGNSIRLAYGMNIPESDFCAASYLEIRKNNSAGSLLGRFCRFKHDPKSIMGAADHIVSNETLWIKFKYFAEGNTERDHTVDIYFERVNGGLTTSRIIESPLVVEGESTIWEIELEENKEFLFTIEYMHTLWSNPMKFVKRQGESDEVTELREEIYGFDRAQE